LSRSIYAYINRKRPQYETYLNRHSTESKFHNSRFIAWDGEGITGNDGKHKYALFMNNEGKVILNSEGLSTIQCLDLIMSTDEKAIHVAFGMSYDANMIFKDIPYLSLKKIHQGRFDVRYGKYLLKYRPHKCLEIRRLRQQWWKTPKLKKYDKSIMLWDVFGFFGLSFIESLKQYGITENLEYISKGKKHRGDFTKEMLQSFVQPYCKMEVDALVQLMNKLREYIKQADFEISRWDGAGACAAALLTKYNIKQYLNTDDFPIEVILAGEYGYFGGRIETIMYGIAQFIYHYDIRSAYPYALWLLFAMIGKWYYIKEPTNEQLKELSYYYIARIEWNGYNLPFNPYPYRAHTGNVYFPPAGHGWIWSPEIKAAFNHYRNGQTVQCHELWYFVPESNIQSFSFIYDLFELRKLWKLLGIGGEKALKLALNSIYGKLAQSVGYDVTRGKKPPFHNIILAGLITSITRARLFEAAMQKPYAICSMATDGIYSTQPLQLDCSDSLGMWEFSFHESMTLVQSGVYWHDTKQKDGSIITRDYFRGFDKDSISREKVIQAWKDDEYKLTCKATRFIGLGSALARGTQEKFYQHWQQWETIDRELGITADRMAKREEYDYKNKKRGHESLVRTWPAPVLFPEILSQKYKFGWDDDTNLPQIDGVSTRSFINEYYNTNS